MQGQRETASSASKSSSSGTLSPILKTPTSPRGPGKSVSFADDLFTYHGSDVDEDEEEFSDPFRRSWPRAGSSGSECSYDDELSSCSRFLVACFAGLPKKNGFCEDKKSVVKDICLCEYPPHYGYIWLERVKLNRLCFSGSVFIKNVQFQKNVFIRYTFDSWAHHSDHPCTFESKTSGLDNEESWDRFTFMIFVPYYFQVGSFVDFCLAVEYPHLGGPFWDNNQGQNYSLQCIQKVDEMNGFYIRNWATHGHFY